MNEMNDSGGRKGDDAAPSQVAFSRSSPKAVKSVLLLISEGTNNVEHLYRLYFDFDDKDVRVMSHVDGK
jgi:hypothetical protein